MRVCGQYEIGLDSSHPKKIKNKKKVTLWSRPVPLPKEGSPVPYLVPQVEGTLWILFVEIFPSTHIPSNNGIVSCAVPTVCMYAWSHI